MSDNDKPVDLEDVIKRLPTSSIARIDKRYEEIKSEIENAKPAKKPVKAPAFRP